jgi:hypothetical protein
VLSTLSDVQRIFLLEGYEQWDVPEGNFTVSVLMEP